MVRSRIFIVGSGRSGTTLFNRMIGMHPLIWSFKWESQVYSGINGACELMIDGFSRSTFNKFRDRMLTHLYQRKVRGVYYAGLYEIIEKSYLEHLISSLEENIYYKSNIIKNAARENKYFKKIVEKINLQSSFNKSNTKHLQYFCDGIFNFGCEKQKRDAKFICEKTPRNILYADEIKKLHPDAKFIHMVRDGRDVLSSVLDKSFWPVARDKRRKEMCNFVGDITFNKLVSYWDTIINISAEQEKLVGQENWLNLRFEDLVNNTQDTLTQVFDFIGIETEQGSINNSCSIIKQNATNCGRWKTDFTSEQIDLINAASKNNLFSYNYI